MIEIIEKEKDIEEFFNVLKKRGAVNSGDFSDTVKAIVDDVCKNGDEALIKYTKKFDDPNFDIKNVEVKKEELKAAFDSLTDKQKQVLLKSKDRIQSFHEHQKRDTWMYEDSIGAKLGMRYTAIEKVGVYVPGGKGSYPSSVIMNVIPAKVAGCKNITMVTPAPKGYINHAVIAAAYVCGVDHIYKIGGAQAIAALAYGTKTIEAVDKITGPGNIFVALAKKEVYGKETEVLQGFKIRNIARLQKETQTSRNTRYYFSFTKSLRFYCFFFFFAEWLSLLSRCLM